MTFANAQFVDRRKQTRKIEVDQVLPWKGLVPLNDPLTMDFIVYGWLHLSYTADYQKTSKIGQSACILIEKRIILILLLTADVAHR